MSRCAVPALVLAAIVIATSAPAGADDAPSSFALRPGVVVDAARSAVYLMAPGNRIEAVDVASGASPAYFSSSSRIE